MMKKYTVVVLSFLIISCNTSSVEKTPSQIESTSIDSISLDIESDSDKIENDEDLSDTFTIVKFDNLTIELSRLVSWDENKELSHVQGDTCFIESDIGETILGQKVIILSSKINDLKIEQSFETSVTISAEGPHCDLLNWKHFRSDWVVLNRTNDSTFNCAKYNKEDLEQFPEVEINELREIVKKQCGKEWYDLVKKVTKPTEYPSEVGVSKVYLKITGTVDGVEVVKIIVINEAMGC